MRGIVVGRLGIDGFAQALASLRAQSGADRRADSGGRSSVSGIAVFFVVFFFIFFVFRNIRFAFAGFFGNRGRVFFCRGN